MAVLCVDLIGSYITDQEDQEITWRPQDPAEVANASRAYDEWTARGYTPHLDHAWQILREFDPNVGRIVFGAPRYPMTGEQQEKIAVPILRKRFAGPST